MKTSQVKSIKVIAEATDTYDISVVANNAYSHNFSANGIVVHNSGGIEPEFGHHYIRNILVPGNHTKEDKEVYSYTLYEYLKLNPEADINNLPPEFAVADDLTPQEHIDVQAAAQRWIDSSISKTINIPTDYPYDKFKEVYMYAYDQGLKGCFELDSSYNTVVLSSGQVVTLSQLFALGIGTEIKVGPDQVGTVETLFYNGLATVARYTFSNKAIIDCTDDHEFETGVGEFFPIAEIHKQGLALVDGTHVTAREPLVGKRLVVDLKIKTNNDDHVYMVNGLRVHNCTVFRFNPNFSSGVLVRKEDLANTTYRFTLQDGQQLEVKGDQYIEYEGQRHLASNLADALKNGSYKKT